jgi:hypothetical protein
VVCSLSARSSKASFGILPFVTWRPPFDPRGNEKGPLTALVNDPL